MEGALWHQRAHQSHLKIFNKLVLKKQTKNKNVNICKYKIKKIKKLKYEFFPLDLDPDSFEEIPDPYYKSRIRIRIIKVGSGSVWKDMNPDLWICIKKVGTESVL